MPLTKLPPFLQTRRHHWKARAMLEKEFKEVFAAEIISISGGLLAGTLIASYVDKLLLIPGLFILLPGFLEMRGNISGSLAARIGTALDLKWISTKNKRVIMQNILASFIEAIAVALSLATVAYVVTYIFFGEATQLIFVIALIATFISNLIESLLATYTTIWLFKKGHDPNNVMGPYVTTTGDIVSVISLLLAVGVTAWL